MTTPIKIYSNTLIKNGEPFTKLIFEQVEPFVEKMFVTVSEKSNDGTTEILHSLKERWGDRFILDTENVSRPYLLTRERQKQLDQVPDGGWVLFLDADDYWPTDQLELVKMFMKDDVDALAINPFQVVDKETYDKQWCNKWFTKFFRKDPSVHYRFPWPRDMIFKGEDILYWRKNSRVPRISIRFFHLSNLMKWRFRDEAWAEDYKSTIGKPVGYDPGWEDDIEKIWSCLK